MRIIITALLLVISCHASAQTLTLADIFEIRKMDWVELSSFAREKGFVLKKVDVDVNGSRHKYVAAENQLVSFERTFPGQRNGFEGDESAWDSKAVYYNFSDSRQLKSLKKQVRKRHFKFKKTDVNEIGLNKFVHNTYVFNNDEVDLTRYVLYGQSEKYTLKYYSTTQ